jgi:hypothetical protein
MSFLEFELRLTKNDRCNEGCVVYVRSMLYIVFGPDRLGRNPQCTYIQFVNWCN